MCLVKGVLKIFSKFTGEHPCRSVISIKLLSNFIEVTLRHRYSPVNLLHIFIGTPMEGCFCPSPEKENQNARNTILKFDNFEKIF